MRKRKGKSEDVFVELLSQAHKTSIIMPNKNDTANVVNFNHQKYSRFKFSADTCPKYVIGDNIDVPYLPSGQRTKTIASTLANQLAIESNCRLILGAINAALLLVNIWPYVFSLLIIINNSDTALANNGDNYSGTGFNRKVDSGGLKLNNFIPHFEPLYYDRHRFLHQYTRLKRNIVERKQQTKQQNESNGKQSNGTNELNDGTSIKTDANNKTMSVIYHSNTVDINTDDYHNNNYQNNRDDHHYHPAPGPNDSQRDQKMIPDSDSKTFPIDINNNGNNSSMIMVTSASTTTTSTMTTAMINFTATTIAFLRHNCPLPAIYDPYYYHHDHIHDTAEEQLYHHYHNHYQVDQQELIGQNFDNSKDYSRHAKEFNPEVDMDQELSQDYHSKKIRLEFSSHNRKFNLVLQSQSETVFAPDVVFESTKRNQFAYDMTNVIIGHLEDDEDSIFMGIITQDGLLDGHLQTRNNEYYIEPASRYFDLTNGQHDFHSVIYHSADVNFPSNASHGAALLNGFSGYDSIVQYFPLNPFRFSTATSHWYFGYDNPWTFGNNDNGDQHLIDKRSKRSITINGKSETTTDTSSSTSASNNINNKSTDKIPMEHYRKLKNKAIISNGQRQHNYNSNNKNHGIYWRDMDSLHYTESEPYGIKAVHPRTHWIDDQRHHDRHVVVDPKKTTCMLYLQADHLFYEKMGSEEACIESMTRHVQKVNNIYKNTDFDQDGRPDNISFLIKRIKVHTMDALNDPEYRYPSTYGVEKFLELFSEEDYDAFCLAYMFTYRDFEGGTLGLAWTGDLKNAGGVCEKNGHYRGSLKSLNTGIVTLLNYGKHVPPIVSHVTLAHEIGHNFGSPHDPEDDHACTPGGENGNYIMFARATSGDKRNNNKFSPCSLRSINAVLNTKAKSLKGCFQEPQDAICGNEVVEDGEECDCGWEEDCKEPCCFPMRANSPPDEPPCRLRPNVICSPSQGPCCTQDCKLKVGNKCRDDNGCRTASYCNGQGPQCPPSTNKANKTICNEEYVCYMGECTGSICMAYGLESCQCKQGPNDSPAKLCELCCRMPSDDSTCKSSFEWNTSPYDVPDLYAKPGTPCDNYNGYCDVNQRCREVDPSSPLATLRRLLLSNESMASLKRWFNEQWFYVAVLVLITVLILLMAYKVFNSRRSLRLTKTDIMEVALEAVAKHQQEQQAQQAQQAQQQAQQQQQQVQQQNSSQNNSDNAASISTINQSSTKSSSSTTTTLTNNLSLTSTVSSTATSSSYSISSSSTTKTTSTNHLQSIGTTTTAAIASNTSSISSPTNLTTIAPPPNGTSRNSIDSNAQSGLLDNGTNANYAANKYCTPITQTESTYSSSSTSTPVVTFNIPTSNASGVKSLDSSSISNSKSYLLSSSSSSDANTKQLTNNVNVNSTNSNSNNIYGTNSKLNSATPGHNHNHLKTGQHDVYYSKHSTLYHHPFASGNAHQQMVNSLYGYTSDVHHPAQGTGSNSQSTVHQSQQHHHSIPSLYHPSNMIYPQHQPAILQQHSSTASQSYYDTAAAGSLAIVGHQAQHPNYTQTHYGSNNNSTAYEQVYGQHYYGYRSSHLSNYGTTGGANFYQPATASTALYDYLPYSGNSNHQVAKPPPLPSMATHPSLQYNHHHGTIESATLKPSTINKDAKNSADGFNSRRSFYSAKDSAGIYGIGNSALNKSSTNITNGNANTNNGTHNNNNNPHFYYYSSLSSNYDNPSSTASSAAKFAHHYGTMLTNHNHNHHSKSSAALTGSTGGSNHSHGSRHYQHYYPIHNHGMAVLSGINDHHQFHQTRAHHSSHPQLLDTQSFSLPTRAAAIAAASPATNHHLTSTNNLVATNNEPIYHSGVYRRHTTDLYEPLATLPLTSISHFGYSLEHASAGHGSDSIYYSARSDISGFPHGGHPVMQPTGASSTAQYNLGLQSQSLHRLHHSNSFHGHLDDLDFLDSNGAAGTNADAGFSTTTTTISRNSHDRNSPRLITRNSDRDRDLDQGTSKSESGLQPSKQMKQHSGSSGWV